MKLISIFIISALFSISCEKEVNPKIENATTPDKLKVLSKTEKDITVYDEEIPTIHIMVALCDNENQGIVPVPKAIGNGEEPKNNLYWGAMYGMKTFFYKSSDWKLIKSVEAPYPILERLVYKSSRSSHYLIADAYDGEYIQQCTEDFLSSSAGLIKDSVQVNGKSLGINGNADLVGYVGHNGLMDFEIDENFKNIDGKQRDVIVLACYSRNYFAPQLQDAKVRPLVWSTHFMAPEAYVVHGALKGYLNNESPSQISQRAADAYHQYQKCGQKAARRLLVNGW